MSGLESSVWNWSGKSGFLGFICDKSSEENWTVDSNYKYSLTTFLLSKNNLIPLFWQQWKILYLDSSPPLHLSTPISL